jgi:hypothetical protein
MTRTARTTARAVLAFAFLTTVLVTAPHFTGPRDVTLDIPACHTCGHAAPIVVTCDGLDWQVYGPGAVQTVASEVCPAGVTYSWKALP